MGSGDDKPLSKEDVARSREAPATPPVQRPPNRRTRFTYSALGWGWTLFWVCLFFALVGTFGVQVVIHVVDWSWHTWDDVLDWVF